MSEPARIALLQEMMRDAKRDERGGLLVCLVGVVVSVAGFSTLPLARNSLELGVVGLVIAAVGFAVYLHYARLYSRFVGQLAKIADNLERLSGSLEFRNLSEGARKDK